MTTTPSQYLYDVLEQSSLLPFPPFPPILVDYTLRSDLRTCDSNSDKRYKPNRATRTHKLTNERQLTCKAIIKPIYYSLRRPSLFSPESLLRQQCALQQKTLKQTKHPQLFTHIRSLYRVEFELFLLLIQYKHISYGEFNLKKKLTQIAQAWCRKQASLRTGM
jgi:hypothetical protein